jgi:hypothetical protein
MNFACFRLFLFFIIMGPVASCSLIGELNHRQFAFTKDNRYKKLCFRLPKGPVEETYRVGENDAKEQFYYFGDGSVLYVARNITWQTINKFRIDRLGLKDKEGSKTFSGQDDGGLFWKEIQFEDFRIGYGYVSAERFEHFNKALNSVKIK